MVSLFPKMIMTVAGKTTKSTLTVLAKKAIKPLGALGMLYATEWVRATAKDRTTRPFSPQEAYDAEYWKTKAREDAKRDAAKSGYDRNPRA